MAALLPNRTIEIHSLETQAIAQVISPTIRTSSPSSPSFPTSSSDPRGLVASLTGYLVPSTQRTEKLRLTPVPLILPSPVQSSTSDLPPESNENAEVYSGEKEPSISSSSSSYTAQLPPPKSLPPSPTRLPLFPRSNVLVLSDNAVQSLLPSTLISQADALLESHRIEETVDLADQNRRKLLGNLTVDEDQVGFRFHHLRVALFLNIIYAIQGRRAQICLSADWLPMHVRDAL